MGNLIYEAFSQEYPENYVVTLNKKPLKEILTDFNNLVKDQVVVFHNAQHDLQVLNKSYEKVGITQKKFSVSCSYQLGKQYFPNLASYSLENLSKKLNLKVNKKYFNSQQAHNARYDAAFTFELYCKIMNQRSLISLAKKPNPFNSNRVDNPFQDHLDLSDIYQEQFQTLILAVNDIKRDRNHQSKGIVVTGEPGMGKTHLMMRLAKEKLQVNRLLFIRQPNNPDAVIYHIYTRILESLAEKVKGEYTQLQHLLAHSFVKLISTINNITLTQKDQDILLFTKDNPLELYEKLGAENTRKKLDYWQHIEKRANEWWFDKYGGAGYSPQIIKGIVKFCGYSDPIRRQLVTRWLAADSLNSDELNKIGLDNWQNDMSREAFSLEAIAVFSKLSLLDEPLIIVFDQLEGLGLPHNHKLLLSFGEAIKEIFTHVPNSLIILNFFPNRWEQFKTIFDDATVDRASQFQVFLDKPKTEQLQNILQLKLNTIELRLEEFFTDSELKDILECNSIRAILNRAADYYHHKVNKIALPKKIEHTRVENVFSNHDNNLHQRLEAIETELLNYKAIFSKISQFIGELNIIDENQGKINDPDEATIKNYIADTKKILLTEYQKPQIITDHDDIGKLKNISEAFKIKYSLELDHLMLGKKKLPEHLVIQNQNQKVSIGFLGIGGISFTSRVKNHNELVISNKDVDFLLLRDCRQDNITGKKGEEEIKKLNHTHNGQFMMMDEDNRINFELLYSLVVAIENKDLDVSLDKVISVISNELKDYWLVQVLTGKNLTLFATMAVAI